jgi:hypothetical protein
MGVLNKILNPLFFQTVCQHAFRLLTFIVFGLMAYYAILSIQIY